MKIYLITDSQNFYGQKLYPWESLDIFKIISKLEKLYPVEHVTFNKIVNTSIDIENSIVIYTSSQQSEYKEYIEDVLLYLMQKGNILIPSINVFKSHENKGYQELHKKILGIKSLKVSYFGHYKEMKDADLKFPIVIKALDGFGSGGVSLVGTKKEIVDFSTEDDCLIHKGYVRTIKSAIAKPIKKYILQQKNKLNPGDYFDYFKRFILQEFIPNLTYDYKVLVFGEKYYVLKRYVKEGDFKASGSGNFAFVKVEDHLLDYAKELFEKFNEPMMGFDICFDGYRYYLIEFQGMHFGPYTLINSDGYYLKKDNNWEFVKKKSDIDEEVTNAFFTYIRNKRI
jgi:glutathione synthase/RimK-type ligase-like ATP-grasp enzyme